MLENSMVLSDRDISQGFGSFDDDLDDDPNTSEMLAEFDRQREARVIPPPVVVNDGRHIRDLIACERDDAGIVETSPPPPAAYKNDSADRNNAIAAAIASEYGMPASMAGLRTLLGLAASRGALEALRAAR